MNIKLQVSAFKLEIVSVDLPGFRVGALVEQMLFFRPGNCRKVRFKNIRVLIPDLILIKTAAYVDRWMAVFYGSLHPATWFLLPH